MLCDRELVRYLPVVEKVEPVEPTLVVVAVVVARLDDDDECDDVNDNIFSNASGGVSEKGVVDSVN